jgi:hypothetical protein
MADLRHNLGGVKIILKGWQFTKGARLLRNTNCMRSCHTERVVFLVSDLQIAVNGIERSDHGT